MDAFSPGESIPNMSTLQFNGTTSDYIEITDSVDFSVAKTGSLTVSAWMRPDVLTFPNSESTGYVHWVGKGEAGAQEWTFRMYNETTTDVPPRPNRISFYVFNLEGEKKFGVVSLGIFVGFLLGFGLFRSKNPTLKGVITVVGAALGGPT